MHGLEQLRRLNDQEAARFLIRRYEKLELRARRRNDNVRADRYRRRGLQFLSFLEGKLHEFPGRSRRKPRLAYPVEFTERVSRLDPGNGTLRRDLQAGRPVAWWLESFSKQEGLDQWQRRQLGELLGYYRLICQGVTKARA
jgi:hypothetical protein